MKKFLKNQLILIVFYLCFFPCEVKSNTDFPLLTLTTYYGEVQLGVDRSQYNEVRWLNERGDIIGNAETVKVTPKAGNSKFTVQLMTEKGEVVGDSIMLDGTYGIKAVTASTNLLEVTLNDKAPAHAKILISSVTDGARKITENVSAGTNTVNINTSKLPNGLYVAGYYVDNELIDQKKINIQH